MDPQELIPHLFRKEYSKVTAVLCNVFGLEHIEIAEDIASDTFLLAFETWNYKGIPANPTAWLYTVAKNKAKNYLQRHNVFAEKILKRIQHSSANAEEVEIDLSEKNITDSLLQMLFAICHPSISAEAQIGLSLRILCGFSIDEIADAFLTNKEAINKRLFRAKEKLRLEHVSLKFPDHAEINKRLETVLTTLYLLFSEGYYSQRQNAVVRKDLCLEAMRLTYLLIENEHTNQHPTNALLALMCFHASRLDARTSELGDIILYQDQDENLWNTELIEKGNYFLVQASGWQILSKYYLEAKIAYWHTLKADTVDKWENILQLYNHVLQLEYSPMAALNRTFALSKARNKQLAREEAEKLNLTGNPFYHVLLGELYKDHDPVKAKLHFQQAFELVTTEPEKQNLKKKMDAL